MLATKEQWQAITKIRKSLKMTDKQLQEVARGCGIANGTQYLTAMDAGTLYVELTALQEAMN
jgi:hypothetical protein